MAAESRSFEYTPTWIIAAVSFLIILISLLVERGLHWIGKFLKRKNQDALFAALGKLKEELMLLGFISLLLNLFQGLVSEICVPPYVASYMLPCKLTTAVPESHHNLYFDHTITNGRRLLSTDSGPAHCAREGKVPLLSLEALHQLHIFIFVMAVVHVFFCATTMVLGVARIREWKHWEDLIRSEVSETHSAHTHTHFHHHQLFKQRAVGYWRKAAVVSWLMSFFKQFYGSITKSDYIALRSGFIQAHCPSRPEFNFHNYMLRTLEYDFKKVVGISWYLWLFVVIFLLLDIEGWHTYFWLSFLPLVLLLLVGAKLEHIIAQLAEEAIQRKAEDQEAQPVRPSDEYFWFGKPLVILYLIHFILFQNSFEIAFFVWVWSTYGLRSCIMEKLGFIIPRLLIGVLVQVLCSYSTLPLYALVTQMGSMFKQGMFDDQIRTLLRKWVKRETGSHRDNINQMVANNSKECFEEETIATDQGTTGSVVELSCASTSQT